MTMQYFLLRSRHLFSSIVLSAMYVIRLMLFSVDRALRKPNCLGQGSPACRIDSYSLLQIN